MSSDDPLAAPLAVERRAGGGGALTAIAVIALTVGLASVWSFTALRQLASSIAIAGTEQLSHARATFDAIRARNLDHLRAHCRVMVEDPRRGWALGFLTREFTLDRGRGPETLLAVFVPTNNLYLGDVVLCEPERAVFPDITVEEGIRIFLTGGMAMPPRVRGGAAQGVRV